MKQHVDVARRAPREVLEPGLVVDDDPRVAVGDRVDDRAQHVVGGAVAAGALGAAHGQQVDADALDDARVDLVVEQVALGDAGLEQVGAGLLAGLLAHVADGLLQRQAEDGVEVARRVGVDGEDGAGLSLRQPADEQAGQRGLAGAALAGDGDGGGHAVSLRFACPARPAPSARAERVAHAGNRVRSVCGRKSAEVYSSMKRVVGAQLQVGHLARRRR